MTIEKKVTIEFIGSQDFQNYCGDGLDLYAIPDKTGLKSNKAVVTEKKAEQLLRDFPQYFKLVKDYPNKMIVTADKTK